VSVSQTDLRAELARHGQEHLLEGVEELDAARRESFLARLADVEGDELEEVSRPASEDEVRPAAVVTLADRASRRDELTAVGEAEYAAGRVAVLMVAGGQGTRLGLKGPKGCFPLAPHSGKTIYQLQSEKVISVSRRVGTAIPFLVMTSPMTDDATRAFFAEHDRFGLDESQLRFFVQGTVPSVDKSGRALLAEPGEIGVDETGVERRLHVGLDTGHDPVREHGEAEQREALDRGDGDDEDRPEPDRLGVAVGEGLERRLDQNRVEARRRRDKRDQHEDERQRRRVRAHPLAPQARDEAPGVALQGRRAGHRGRGASPGRERPCRARLAWGGGARQCGRGAGTLTRS